MKRASIVFGILALVMSFVGIAVGWPLASSTQYNDRRAWTFFPVLRPAGLHYLIGLTPGPNDAVFVTSYRQALIYRVSASGVVSPVLTPEFYSEYLTTGSDGDLYVAGYSSRGGDTRVDVLTGAGKLVREVSFDPSPSGDSFEDTGIILGPDGNVWLCEFYHVASISPSGKITEYPVQLAGNSPNWEASLVVGPRKVIWFTVRGNYSTQGSVANIDPATGKVVSYHLPYAACGETRGMAFGGDGNLYVACLTPGVGPLIARVTQTGRMSAIPYPPGFETIVDDMVEGPHGTIYFSSANGMLMSLDPVRRTFTAHRPPEEAIAGLMSGPNGQVWGAAGYGIDIYRPKR